MSSYLCFKMCVSASVCVCHCKPDKHCTVEETIKIKMMLHNLTATYVIASVPRVLASVRLSASLLMTVLIYTASN